MFMSAPLITLIRPDYNGGGGSIPFYSITAN